MADSLSDSQYDYELPEPRAPKAPKPTTASDAQYDYEVPASAAPAPASAAPKMTKAADTQYDYEVPESSAPAKPEGEYAGKPPGYEPPKAGVLKTLFSPGTYTESNKVLKAVATSPFGVPSEEEFPGVEAALGANPFTSGAPAAAWAVRKGIPAAAAMFTASQLPPGTPESIGKLATGIAGKTAEKAGTMATSPAAAGVAAAATLPVVGPAIGAVLGGKGLYDAAKKDFPHLVESVMTGDLEGTSEAMSNLLIDAAMVPAAGPAAKAIRPFLPGSVEGLPTIAPPGAPEATGGAAPPRGPGGPPSAPQPPPAPPEAAAQPPAPTALPASLSAEIKGALKPTDYQLPKGAFDDILAATADRHVQQAASEGHLTQDDLFAAPPADEIGLGYLKGLEKAADAAEKGGAGAGEGPRIPEGEGPIETTETQGQQVVKTLLEHQPPPPGKPILDAILAEQERANGQPAAPVAGAPEAPAPEANTLVGSGGKIAPGWGTQAGPAAAAAAAEEKAVGGANDRQFGQGIPGQVGVGQEPLQAGNVEGAGAEAPSAGGVVQEEQAGRVAPEGVGHVPQEGAGSAGRVGAAGVLTPGQEKVQGEAPADMQAQETALLSGARQAILWHKNGPQPVSFNPPPGIGRAETPAGIVWFREDSGLTKEKVEEAGRSVEGLGTVLEMPPGGRPQEKNPRVVTVKDADGNEVWSAEVSDKTHARAMRRATKMADDLGGTVEEGTRKSIVKERQQKVEGAPPKPKAPASTVDPNREAVANYLELTVGSGWQEELVGLDRAATEWQKAGHGTKADYFKALASETIGAAPPPAPAPTHRPVAAPKVQVAGWNDAAVGPEDVVETATGTEIPFRYAIVDAREPITSHDSLGIPNPAYPLEGESIQNRNRSDQKSVEQMSRIKGNPKLRLLSESPTTENGAPLIRPDKRVIGGNGRMAGLAAAYAEGTAGEYKADLPAKLKKLGFDEATIKQAMGMERPALVRLMNPEHEYDQTRLARDTNVSSGLQLGPAEKGRSDAALMMAPGSANLTSHVLSLFEENEDANLTSPGNRAFVEAFAKAFVPDNERGSLFTDGRLNPDGAARVRAALVAAAYGDSPVVDRLLEGGGNETAALRTALVNAAPDFAALNLRQKIGELEPIDLTRPITEAAEFINDMRASGRTLESVLRPKYGELVAATDRLTSTGLELVTLIDQSKTAKGARVMTGIFRELAKVGSGLTIDKNQTGLFGEGEIEKQPLPTIEEALRVAKENYELKRNAEENPLFAGAGEEEGPGTLPPSPRGKGPEPAPGEKAGPPKRPGELEEPAPEYGITQSLRDENFKKWFGNSKVVDAEGKPLRVYHGTTADFDEFTRGRAGKKTGNPNAVLGSFFTDDPAEASRYAQDWGREGGRVLPVYLSIQNPYHMPYKEANDLAMGAWMRAIHAPEYRDETVRFGDKAAAKRAAERTARYQAEARADSERRRAELIADGYDGIVLKIGGHTEYVAFHPEQIKSATANRGTFEKSEPSIVSEPPPEYGKGQGAPQAQPVEQTQPEAAPARKSLGERAAAIRAAEERATKVLDQIRADVLASVPGGVDPKTDPFVVANSILSDELKKRGFVSLLDKKIPNLEALGTLAQVTARADFEVFHVVFTDADGVVLDHVATSVRLPSTVTSGHPEIDDSLWIAQRMQQLGAANFMVWHNHPGGDPQPSLGDFQVTEFYRQIPGFLGHVVIDHNSFTIMRPDAGLDTSNYERHYLTQEARAARPKLFKDKSPDASKNLGFLIAEPEQLARVGMQMQKDNNSITLIFANSIGERGSFTAEKKLPRVKAVAHVPIDKFTDFAWASRRFRAEMGEFGAQHLFAYHSGEGLTPEQRSRIIDTALDLFYDENTISDFMLGTNPHTSLRYTKLKNRNGMTIEEDYGDVVKKRGYRTLPAGMLPATTAPTRVAEEPPEYSPSESPRGKAFKKWFGDSKVVDAEGKPLRVYHGTSGDFEEFNREMADPEGHLGAGFYFTSDPEDAGVNYHLNGPDMESKIERFEEGFMQEAKSIAAETGSVFNEEETARAATKAAHEKFRIANEGAVLPVYLKMENPLVLSPENGMVATFWDGSSVRRLIQTMREFQDRGVFRGFSPKDLESAIASIENYAYDGEDAGVVLDTLRDTENALWYVEDDEGRLVMGEFLRKAVERMGYDGIIDPAVAGKFSGMQLNPETVHYIVFKPTQIKSATGNRGTFGPRTKSIIREEPPDYGKKPSALEYAGRFAPGAARAFRPRGPEDEIRLAATDPTAGIFSEIFASRAPKASKTSKLPSPTDSLSPEVEERMRAAEGIVSPTILERVSAAGKDLEHSFTRHFIELNSKESPTIAADVDILRQLEGGPEFAKKTAFDTINYITDGLDKPAARLLTRIIALHDLRRSIQEGLYKDADELPFGYESPEAVDDDLERYESMAEGDEAVKNAIEKRERYAGELTQKLVDMELLPPDVLKDPRYYHRQVMAIVNEKEAAYVGTGSQDARLHRKGFQKARHGGGDFNLRYQEAEFEWMAQAHSLITMRESLDRLRAANDIKPGLEGQAKWANTLAIYGGIENYNEVQRIKGEIAEIYSTGEIDSEARKQAKALMQKLDELDPLRPFGQRIAFAIHELKAAAEAGELDHVDKEYQEAVDQLAFSSEWEEFRDSDDTPDLFFPLLSHLVQKGKAGSREAAGIFSAIADRKKFIKNELGKEFKTWRDFMPERHPLAPDSRPVEWQPEKGSVFYRAMTLPENVLDRLKDQLEEAPEDVVPKEIVEKVLGKAREAMVRGGEKPVWVIPEGLKKTLDNWKPRVFERGPETVWTHMIQSWKQWVLLNPARALRYNLNNESGDLDVVIAAYPKALKGLAKAAKDLWRYSIREETEDRALVEEMQRAMKLGVLSSGLTVQEIPDINETGAFKALTSDDPNIVQRALQGYWSGVKKGSTLRENMLRLALFRYLEGEIKAGRDLYGASKAHEVRAVKDPTERAAKLTRELIGDYGNISHGGQWIRRHMIPFYSWLEINAPRYVRLLKNAALEDGGTGGGGSGAGGGGGTGGGKGGRVARMAGIGVKKIAFNYAKLAIFAPLLYAAIQLWNHLRYPEEEKMLGSSGRRLHLITGRNADGSVSAIRLQGALSDALDWFGASNIVSDIEDVRSGRSTVKKKLISAVTSPVEKIVGAWEPFSKTVFELAFGYRAYPNLFKEGTFNLAPAQIRDRAEYLADLAWPMGALYRKVTGKPRRPSPDLGIPGAGPMLDGLLTTRTNPGEAAYWLSRQMASQYLEAHGKPQTAPGGGPLGEAKDKADALYYFKRACEWDDGDAAKKWLVEYYKAGGTPEKMRQAFLREHPLGQIPLGQRGAFLKTLSPRDRTTLDTAVHWYEAGRQRAFATSRATPFVPVRKAALP